MSSENSLGLAVCLGRTFWPVWFPVPGHRENKLRTVSTKHMRDGKNEKQRLKNRASGESSSSESLPHKILKHYLDYCILGAIELSAVVLLFPLTWRSTGPDLLVFSFALCLYLRFGRSDRASSCSVRRRLWAGGAALVVFGFALTWPFLVFPKPLYISSLDSANPFRTKATFLQTGDRTIGSVLLVTDPIRKAMTHLLKLMPRAGFRFLERTDASGLNYCVLPVLNNFILDSKSVGDITWKRNLYFPLNVLSRSVSFQLRDPSMLLLKQTSLLTPPLPSRMEFGVSGSVETSLINFAYTQYPDTIPWNAVQVALNNDVSSLNYIAYLDLALENLAVGKTQQSIEASEGAVAIIPPSNLEAARLATMQYVLALRSLTGNVGLLQSLPLLHRAFDLFLIASKEPRFSERDPLTQWLHETILHGYEDWFPHFIDRICKLRALQTVGGETKSDILMLGERLNSKSYAEVLQFLKSGNCSRAEVFYIKAYLVERAISEMIGSDWGTVTEKSEVRQFATLWASVSERALPVMKYIDSRLAETTELKVDPTMIRLLSFCKNDLPKIAERWDEPGETPEAFAEGFAAAKELRVLASIMESKTQMETISKGRACDWWNLKYFLWFAWWSQDAVVEIAQLKNPWKTDYPPRHVDVRNLISTIGPDTLMKDQGGKGRTFLPGLFCLLWYSETLGIEGNESFKREFESKTLISYEQYLSSLRAL